MAALTGLPLAIVELGASAGLNLLWDQYRYVYGGDGPYGVPDAAVVVRSQFRGGLRPALPSSAPPVVDPSASISIRSTCATANRDGGSRPSYGRSITSARRDWPRPSRRRDGSRAASSGAMR